MSRNQGDVATVEVRLTYLIVGFLDLGLRCGLLHSEKRIGILLAG
jgi:hypothetical protein